jgi:hypothetical protein
MSDNLGYYSISDLMRLALPGYPVTRQGWDTLVKREKWLSVEAKGMGGPGGIRREYQPPADVLALIQRRKLAADFSLYRTTIAAGEPLGIAENAFVDDYNTGSNTVCRVDGLTRITVEMLREARRGDPLSVPEQPEFAHQERGVDEIDDRHLKGRVWLNANLLVRCHDAVASVLDARGGEYSEQWRMAASVEAYNHISASIGTDDATIHEMLTDEDFKAAATLGILALSSKRDEELFIIPMTAVYFKPEPRSGHVFPARKKG